MGSLKKSAIKKINFHIFILLNFTEKKDFNLHKVCMLILAC